MKRRSKHISIAGSPNSFDYSSFDNVLGVSSSKCISIFSGLAFDNPSSDLHYELPRGLILSGFQKTRGGVFSCISNDSVAIFNVSDCIRTIQEAIVTPGRILDGCWSPFRVESYATCCDSGFLSLWDLRAVGAASIQIATGKVCHNAKWCPFNENLLSVCCDGRYLMVWDIRMISSKPNCLNIIENNNGIHDYAWDDVKSCIYIGTCRSSVECWSFNSIECDSTCELQQACNCDALTRNSQLLPHPRGQGLLLSNTLSRKVQYLEMHPSTTDDVLWDTSFGETLRGIGFNGRQSIVGMQWVNDTSGTNQELILLTESSMFHHLAFDSNSTTFDISNHTKPFNLRNSRHLVGGLSKDEESSFNSSTKKSASRHPSITTATTAAVKLSTPAVTKEVVGPQSFTNLLEHEIGALDSAIRGGLLDGLKIERFDQIGRRIVLDLLIPSIDPFLVRNKVHDGSFSNYYRADELHQFVKKSSQSHNQSHFGHSNHRLVSLLISFSWKLSSFWNPTFLLDNKCGVDVSSVLFLEFVVDFFSSWEVTL